ncbi:MAG TPA: DDE-type integrase/transposase/recombinase, partial [Beutenbergiaceae bacterium]|nr:DDE-type integrase/transposase/recombinase [Beutenbergiaceae bacterium]
MTKSRKPTAAQRAQKVALFRFQVISPALERELSKAQRGEIVRELIQETYDHPITGPRKYSRESVDRWIRAYHEGGFEALVPAVTKPAPRTDSEVLDLAAGLKTENPNRTAAQVRRILLSSTGWSPSESTLLRLFHARDLMGPTSGEAGEVFGRFEAAHANQRWVGDALHGPKLFGKKTYLFALLDDHSRMLTGYRFAFVEDTLRMSRALRNGLTSRGVPESIYVDNGAPYVDAWLLRACAK